MKVAILGPGKNAIGYTTKRLLEEGKNIKMKPSLIPIIDIRLVIKKKLDAVYEKKSLSDFDYILPRIDSKRARVGYPVMRFLDEMGVMKPYNAETVMVAHNKFITLERLVSKGIDVPETYMTGSKSSALSIISRYKMPVMLKLLSGFGGQGVMLMESKEAARSAIETMRTLKQEILIEKYLPNPGEDIRGIVAGDEIIASYKRIAAKGESRSNIKAGGRGVAFKLTSEMEDICIKSANAIGAKVCAIDMIDTKGKINVLEVNINPGLECIEKATNINVAQKIMDFVKSEIRG